LLLVDEDGSDVEEGSEELVDDELSEFEPLSPPEFEPLSPPKLEPLSPPKLEPLPLA
jgi:hypothetical protein